LTVGSDFSGIACPSGRHPVTILATETPHWKLLFE
jgi:hypothetical protein